MAGAKKSKKKSELVGQPDPRAALDSPAFLAAAKPLLARLEDDLRERALASPAVTAALTARYEAEKQAQRTADSFAGWTAALATQVAAAWLLSCVFVRTLEDRGLLKQGRLAGPGAEDSQRQFFQLAPSLTERDYLLMVFRELARHPAAAALFDAEHSLVWKLSPSAEVAKELLTLFRAPSASEPAFRFGQESTRFLGDLYQDLSEDVRKRYALLQTPDFVESYILDRTLEPAIARFGLDDTTLIDPTCGSGHFLLGAFDRLFEHRQRTSPGLDPRTAAVQALDCVHGADINPYAVAIARFRLTLAFLEKAKFSKLADAPELPLHLVCADSLRINPQHPQQELWQYAGANSSAWLGDVFAFDDEKAAREVLGQQYAAVVANPPYITVKDAAVRDLYRNMYTSCHRTYSLSAPFCERIFQLARTRGYTGQITANSFMKREFGKPLIEEYLPTVNLDGIVNTSGAYIPGHGTPTVLLFGTKEPPQGVSVVAVLAKRGEPSTPNEPSQGVVWRSVVEHGDEIGFENDYLSVARIGRDALAKHPWSLGGGGASELKELLEQRAESRLSDHIAELGRSTHTGEDGVFFMDKASATRLGFKDDSLVPLVKGEQVRDWSISDDEVALFPYDQSTGEASAPAAPREVQYYWRYRSVLRNRQDFGEKIEDRGLRWFEHSMFFPRRFLRPLGISFAFVATHNHFALDRGGKVFNRSAPIIKLPEGATEDEHLALLAYLNSSTAAFFFRQVGHSKGAQGVNEGHKSEQWEQFLEYSGGLVESLPVPTNVAELTDLGRRADELAKKILSLRPGVPSSCGQDHDVESPRAKILFYELCAVQEAIDWRTYRLFGLLAQEPAAESSVEPGARAFEYELARTTPETAWFARNRYRVPTGASPNVTAAELIASIPEIALLEQPEFKRRWTIVDHSEQVTLAHRGRRLAMIEKAMSAASLPMPVNELIAILGDAQRDPDDRTLVAAQSIPFVSVMTFAKSGVAKHEEWLACWEAQRGEDAGGEGRGVVPSRYQSIDYSANTYWQLRGKLNVPRERFISYPQCESDQDGEPVYGWAGWDHLQRAQALAALYLKRRDGEGWSAKRLAPMLAGLLELIPWVKQWHNEPSAEFNDLRMGDYFEQFLDGECRQHGLTHDDLRAWRPLTKTRAKAKAEAGNEENEKAVKKRLSALKRGLESAKHEPNAGDIEAAQVAEKPHGRKQTSVEHPTEVES